MFIILELLNKSNLNAYIFIIEFFFLIILSSIIIIIN